MNGGGKAEKENTPSEANLQEEEVLRGVRQLRGRGAQGVGGGCHGTPGPEGAGLGPRASECLGLLHNF